MPEYRQAPLDLLAETFGDDFQVCAGPFGFEPGIETRVILPGHLIAVRNHFFLRRRLLWQSGSLRKLISAETAILELNPRILSVWFLLLARRLFGRTTILWGHAWPRSGREARSERVRHLMRKLADTVIVYTETQARELQERMPTARIVAAPNALYSAREMRAPDVADHPADFLYVGRLIPAKKPMLLLDAFDAARSELPRHCRLMFIGDGPLRAVLEESVADRRMDDVVTFSTAVFDREKLSRLYGRALASVSPGYVGLSLIQSLSFGVPMILASGEPHSPEIEAATDGKNAVIFEGDSVSSLARALITVARAADTWIARRGAIAHDCAQRYSVEVMVTRMVEAVQTTKTDRWHRS